MSVNVSDVVKFFEDDFADIKRQSSWDFSGSQVYLGNLEVKKICLALDPSGSVIKQAIDGGCGLLITHHPLFFTSSKGLNINKTRDRLVIDAIKNDLSILSYHTNLDMADNGINAFLLNLLNAENKGILSIEDGEYGIGYIGEFSSAYSMTDFLMLLKEKLEIEHIRTNMESVAPFTRFAICSGSGASLWKDCIKHGVKVLVTGDLKHHDAIDSREAGVCVIDVGHFASEQIYMNFLANVLKNKFGVEVMVAHETPSILDR